MTDRTDSLCQQAVPASHFVISPHSLTDRYQAVLAREGLAVLHTEQEGEDHFTLVERLAEPLYTLTREMLYFLHQ